MMMMMIIITTITIISIMQLIILFVGPGAMETVNVEIAGSDRGGGRPKRYGQSSKAQSGKMGPAPGRFALSRDMLK